ncbi:MAG: hypothetical protein AUK47_13430 [Deltaproteobacteria bacterium CG2_30_63_29]|nr:MAG: hypothetical protein AUK47_13430 [Deltaproteobacteria bacterium CG2_30_63_29]
MRRLLGSALVLCLLLASARASATIPLVEGEDVTLDLAGYLKALTGVQHIPYDSDGLLPETLGMSSNVLRVEWKLVLGERLTMEVHDRLFWKLLSEPTALGSSLGLGATAQPKRSVDLSTKIVDKPTNTFVHDLDRLFFRLYFDFADFTVGRQAITWGRSSLFTVADIWTTFSPFELDLSEKPGVDAVRMLTSYGEGSELEGVVVDRGSIDDLSGGLKWTTYLDFGDLFLSVAKDWENLMLLGGVSAEVDVYGVRGEVAWPAFDLDDQSVGLPRVTAGLDTFGNGWFSSLELHYNGAGSQTDNTGTAKPSKALGRGEVYWMGRYYAGAVVGWTATDLLTLTLSALGNLSDPSVMLAPSLVYRFSNEAEVSAGGYVGLGESPDFLPSTKIPSEFGAYGNLYFVQLAGYY